MPSTRCSNSTPTRWPRRLGLALLLSASLPSLAGCDSPIRFGDLIRGRSEVWADTTCKTMRPIGWSDRDTDQTIREVRAHNAALIALCPELTPKEAV